jgi:nucleoside-diphosphate-sugar epimerase
MKILVTGSTGFVGRALCDYLNGKGFTVIPVVRNPSNIPASVKLDADDEVGWQKALQGCDVVVHLAGKSKADKKDSNAMATLYNSNVIPTISLYRRATLAGARRFIFISTAKVHGERTTPGTAFSEDDPPAPQGAYALSKWAAETRLRALASESSPELVVIRPPVVYGPGVKGSFASLVKLTTMGVPLPFGCVPNRRSMIGIDNLTDFIARCVDPSASASAANQTFLVSDGRSVSTTEVLRTIGTAYGVKSRLFCVSPALMQDFLTAINKPDVANRLFGSLVIDDTKVRRILGWLPPISMIEQLKRMHQ